MTDEDRARLLNRLKRATAAARKLSPEEARCQLVALGLYDADGRLSERYGGGSRSVLI